MSSKNPPRTPKVCHHRPTGRAYVKLGGHAIYCGQFSDPLAHEKGHRLIAEWLSNGRRLRVEPKVITLTEVIAAYTDHVEAIFKRADGTPSQRSIDNVITALAIPKRFYGTAPAVQFGPLALRACISHWVESGLRRTTCNKRLGDVKRCIKWAVSMEMLPPATFHALATVEGLRHGRTTAKESRVVNPVPEAHFWAIRGTTPSSKRKSQGAWVCSTHNACGFRCRDWLVVLAQRNTNRTTKSTKRDGPISGTHLPIVHAGRKKVLPARSKPEGAVFAGYHRFCPVKVRGSLAQLLSVLIIGTVPPAPRQI